MKKLMFICMAVLLNTGLFAQTDSAMRMNQGMDNKMNHDMDKAKPVSNPHQTMNTSHPDGVMMKDGKMMMVQHGKMTPLNHEVELSDGTKIMTDGTCIKKDGTKMKMKNGQHMDMSGNMAPMNNTKTSTVKSTGTTDKKDMYLVPDSTVKK